MTEKMLAYHCGPALAGIKPANLISLQKTEQMDEELLEMNQALNQADIYIEALYQCKNRLLILVYRKNKLERYLSSAGVSEFLADQGYPRNVKADRYLAYLKKRFSSGTDFPHEIGAFLGYPLHDIFGFINHGRAIFTGYWKVYQNAEEAKKLFQRYDSCRSALVKRVEAGKSIAEIFGAA